MTAVEAARRLGVHETQVVAVELRRADCVVTLRNGARMLVSDTTARAYVPEVDDVRAEGAPKAEAPKKTTAKRAAGAKGA